MHYTANVRLYITCRQEVRPIRVAFLNEDESLGGRKK